MGGRIGVGSGAAGLIGGLLFSALATGGIALVGLLAVRGHLPTFESGSFVGTVSGWGGVALGVWMATAALVSLGLPAATLLVWGREAAVRAALLAYVAVLCIQVGVEMVFSGVFFADIVVLTGIVFTGYRLGQLRAARRLFAGAEGPSRLGRVAVSLCLSLGLAFWSANLLFLVLVALPRAVGFG